MYTEADVLEDELEHHYIKNLEEWTRVGEGVRMTCSTNTDEVITVELLVYDDGIIRFQLIPDRIDNPNQSVIPIYDPKSSDFQIEETEDHLSLETDTLEVRISHSPWSFDVVDQQGRRICEDNLEDIDSHGNRRSLIHGYTTDWKDEIVGTNVSLRMAPDDAVYGLGEKFTELNKRGRTVTVQNKNPYGVGTEESYKNIPFLMNSSGYGLFLNTTYKNVWELGSESNNVCSLYTEDEILDLFFIFGPELKQVIDGYTDITGKPPLPPKWSLGIMMMAAKYDGNLAIQQDEILELAKEFRRDDLPSDCIYIQRYWMGLNPEDNDLEFDEDLFPAPEEFSEEMGALGFKRKGWICPYIRVESSMFEEGKKNGYLLKDCDGSVATEYLGRPFIGDEYEIDSASLVDGSEVDEDGDSTDPPDVLEDMIVGESADFNFGNLKSDLDDERFYGHDENQVRTITRSDAWRWQHRSGHYELGGFVDFTNPEAVKWWQEKVQNIVDRCFDTFMTDFAEETPINAVYHNGKEGAEMYNFYSTLYQKATYEAIEKTGKEPVLRARSGYAGLQNYPACWPGDPGSNFEDMAATIRAGLSIGLSGVPFWMTHIGPFDGRPEDELFIRWAQAAMFSSHSDPGYVNPHMYPKEIKDIYREYAYLRYRLLPYIYSYCHEATKSGLPLMRPLFLEFGDGVDDVTPIEFMFGSELLVAPICRESSDGSGEVTREVYLPEGNWINYWSTEEYEGPSRILYDASLDELPLFVQSDSIIPHGPDVDYIGDKEFDPITLDIYLQSSAEFVLFDDGQEIDVECTKSEDRISLTVTESHKTFVAEIHNADSVDQVTIDGTEAQEFESRADLEESEEGWFSDSDALFIKFSTESEDVRVEAFRSER